MSFINKTNKLRKYDINKDINNIIFLIGTVEFKSEIDKKLIIKYLKNIVSKNKD